MSPSCGYQTSEIVKIIAGDAGLNKTLFTVDTSYVEAGSLVIGEYPKGEYPNFSDIKSWQGVKVSPPENAFVTIDPMGTHNIGDVFFINGTTNLPIPGNWILSLTNQEGVFNNPPRADHAQLSVVFAGSISPGIKRWSANATDSAKYLISGEYQVLAGNNRVASNTSVFTLLPAKRSAGSFSEANTIATAPTSLVVMNEESIFENTSNALSVNKPSPIKSAGFSILVMLLCFSLIGVFAISRH